MKCRLNIEVRARVSQAGNYGNALYLGGDSYTLEMNTLTEAAAILVKFLELADELPEKTEVQAVNP